MRLPPLKQQLFELDSITDKKDAALTALRDIVLRLKGMWENQLDMGPALANDAGKDLLERVRQVEETSPSQSSLIPDSFLDPRSRMIK